MSAKETLHILSVCRTTFADIHSNIEDGSTYTANEFALCERRPLEMKPTHHTITGHGLIVLYEINLVSEDGSHLLIEFSLRETFKKVATLISKYLGFYNQNPINCCFYYVHVIIL